MERLRPYLDNGILELDNNAAERGMRAVNRHAKLTPYRRPKLTPLCVVEIRA
jgi:hypothetical protein